MTETSTPHTEVAATTVRARGAFGPGQPLGPLEITRRALRAEDVAIAVEYAGICHSDIHTMAGDFGERQWPLVPGHEIVGVVTAVGAEVTRYRPGDRVGVGCFINSCGQCDPCAQGEISYCENGVVGTYGGVDRYTDHEYTQGGYSQAIVVRESFVVRIPAALDPAEAAPLLCAGITTYAPLKKWGAGPGTRVAVIGMGGLGHVGVKIAVALGADVTVLSHSDRKRADALAFGAVAHHSTREGLPAELERHFDLILNTVSADLDIDAYLGLLRFNGVLVQLGLPGNPMQVTARSFTQRATALTGSLVGGIAETQEMLDFCAEHRVAPVIERIDADHINEAYQRTVDSEVRYRFVIDAATI